MRVKLTTRERIASGVSLTALGCWRWNGSIDRAGYARIHFGGRNALAHRVAYEAYVSPIPPGMTIDHLCRNRACVNVAHMEVVTLEENSRRGLGWRVAADQKKARTHCPRGHEFTPENTYLERNQHSRKCRECVRITMRAWREARGAA